MPRPARGYTAMMSRSEPEGAQRLQTTGADPEEQAAAKLSVSKVGSPFAHVELPIPRDRLLHLGVGCTLLFLALSATLSHAVAGAGEPAAARSLAWLPLGYGIIAASSSFVLALRRRPSRWAYRGHGVAMAAGWVIGLAGALVHAAAAGRAGLTLSALFGSVSLAPLAFVGVAVVGWITAWSDEALGVGRVPHAVATGVAPAVPGRRALLLVTAAGFAALVVTTVVDHGGGVRSWTEAIAALAAITAFVAVVVMLPGRGSERLKIAYVGVMLSTVLVGFAGLALHLSANMSGPPQELIGRMVLQAPLMAPLLFGLLGMLGLLAVAEPAVDLDALEAAWPPVARYRRPRRFRGAQVDREDGSERGA